MPRPHCYVERDHSQKGSSGEHISSNTSFQIVIGALSAVNPGKALSRSAETYLNIMTHLVASSLTDNNRQVGQVTSKPALHHDIDKRPMSGGMAPLSRSLKGEKHLNNFTDSHGSPLDRIADVTSPNPFEPALQSSSNDASSLDGALQAPQFNSHKREVCRAQGNLGKQTIKFVSVCV